MADTESYDLVIVGGGVNGVGIARDAAGRGLSVLVVERADLASATSSASTKLIHGGLRYLEYYEFRLVRESLSEREVLLESAAHIIRPLRFVLPHDKSLRPAWMIRIGLFLYDHLGGRKRLPGSRGVDLRKAPYSNGLAPGHSTGFEYSDCWVDDARMVALNAVDARERGARIETRTSCISAQAEGGQWSVEIKPDTGPARRVRGKVLVNATGPWAGRFLGQALGRNAGGSLRLVKGSHIVVPRLYEGEHAFILQNTDRRIVFTIPYETKFTLIGTTDIPTEGDPAEVAISTAEIDYLCDLANRYFTKRIGREDVVWTYAGVRPLFDEEGGSEAAAVSRDYVLDLETPAEGAALLNVFGGKITTYRRLAEHALQKLKPLFPAAGGDWTAKAKLPGGDIADADFKRFHAELASRYAWLPPTTLLRMARAYGTRIDKVIGNARALGDLGEDFEGLSEREIGYLVDQEWARSADDVLWRRSKLGLHLSAEARARVAAWFAGGQKLREAAGR